MVHLVIQVSIWVLIFTIFSGCGECVRTSKKIYITLNHVRGCFRVLNATHQIGCSSKMGGNIGVVHYVETDADLDWIINVGPHAPYMPLMSSLNFNITNVRRLKDSGKVSGILVSHLVHNSSVTPVPPEGESPAHKCPLSDFGMYSNNSELSHCKKVTWNPQGSSFMYEDFGIPIFVVLNETEVNHIIYDCYEKFNKPNPNGTAKTFPLCSAELKSPMAATTDSVTCIRRTKHVVNLSVNQFCDPMGDKNIIATVKETSNIEPLAPGTVILAAARMDSYTMFDQVSPSADNDVTGIVTLLAAAQALAEAGLLKQIKNDTTAKDILFTFFQGEAFDYIGSSRMVYEMEKKRFPTTPAEPDEDEADDIRLHPIGLEHLSHLVEVSQLGGEEVWLHTDPLTRNLSHIDTQVREMVESLVRSGKDHSVTARPAGKGQPLPPASLHRFLMKRSLPAVLLTDHQAEFTNRFYQSRFDLPREINATYPDYVNRSSRYDYITVQASRLADRSAMLAQFLYSLSTGKDVNVTVNETMVTNLLFCFLYNGSCELFRTVVTTKDEKKLTNATYPFYVSVARETNPVSTLTRKVLAYFIGDTIDVSNSDDCKGSDKDKLYQYIWMQGPLGEDNKRHGICVMSTVTFTEAKSPIFLDEMEGYDWAKGEYSSWTESTWDDFSVRLFLVPSQQFQTATLSSGVIVLLVSMVLVYFINSNAKIIFSSKGPRTFY